MKLSTAPIFFLRCFSQVRILRFAVHLLSATLGAISLVEPGSADGIDSLKSNSTSSQVLTHRSILLAQSSIAQPSTSILYVNSSDGKDTASGSDLAPFKTITRALQVAQSGATIVIAPGTYSTETGESFPLVLKAKITLQGDPATRGQEILIHGSGASTSKVLAQSLTIEIVSQAIVNGVTVTNPNLQGYGIGIESSSALITNSTFTNSGYGLVIMGNSTARVQNNYFYQNRTAGIKVAGIAQPIIQDNIFEQTGSAIIVGDRAAPLIANNRMTQNQNGMVFQGSAQSMVRSNSVEGNRQHGLLAKDTSRPDLGTTANLGGNFFRNNGLSDVDVKATNQVISASGNEWLNAVGNLNTTPSISTSSDSAVAFPIPSSLSFSSPAQPPRPIQIVQIVMPSTQVNQSVSLQSVNSIQATSSLPSSSRSLSVTPGITNSSPSTLSTVSPLAIATSSQPPAKAQNSSAIVLSLSAVPQNAGTVPFLETFPLPPSSATQFVRPYILAKPFAPKTVQRNQSELSPPAATVPIAISVPPPEKRIIRSDLEARPIRLSRAMSETPKAAKNVSATLLPVPSPNIPLGKIGEMPSVYSMRGVFQPSAMQNPIFSFNNLTVNNVRFRVVVNTSQEMEQAQVLALVPDAFLITSDNKKKMQVGAFSDRTKAEQLIQTFASQGISAKIELINQ